MQSGSFQHRSMAAALRVQYGAGWTTSILNQTGIQSQLQDEYTKHRKQKCELDNARKVCQKYKKWRLESRGHTCTDSSLDSSYGSTPVGSGIPEVELLWLCKEHLDRLKDSSEDIDNICQSTVDQSDDISGEWMKQRCGCVTASPFGAITKRKSSFVPLVKRLLYGKHVTTRAIRYGHLHEAHAKNAYTKYLLDKHKDATVTKTGLHTDQTHNWIGASPDGIVNDPSSINDPRGLLEVNVLPVLNQHHLKSCVGSLTFFEVWWWEVWWWEVPLSLGLLCSIFTYYAFEQRSKKLSIMLNIKPITTTNMLQFLNNFIILITRLAHS